MAKQNTFVKGDLVSGKKWNGEHFVGVYVHEYDCGDHLVTNGKKEFCIHKNDCHKANNEEAEYIKENILQTIKKNKNNKKEETEMTQEELEKAFTEE